jgi:hypothetical protein
MKECIYCHQLPIMLSREAIVLFCWQCLRRTGVGVLYSYDHLNERFVSISLSFHTKKSHISAVILPLLGELHIQIPSKKFKELGKEHKLSIRIPDVEQPNPYVTLHPWAHNSPYSKQFLHPLIVFPITTILTPDNIRDKVSLYLLMS